MSKPVGVTSKAKDNSRKKHQQNAEFQKSKKLGRSKQRWVEATNTWEKVK
jgi:hypothetical protein